MGRTKEGTLRVGLRSRRCCGRPRFCRATAPGPEAAPCPGLASAGARTKPAVLGSRVAVSVTGASCAGVAAAGAGRAALAIDALARVRRWEPVPLSLSRAALDSSCPLASASARDRVPVGAG